MPGLDNKLVFVSYAHADRPFLDDELMSYGGTCLLDRVTGAQVTVAR